MTCLNFGKIVSTIAFAVSGLMQFDAPEAFYYAENGLAAGTYHFAIDSTYDAVLNDLTSYQFTLTQAVPAGGQLTFPWGSANASTIKVNSYASATSTTAIEQAAVSEGTDGTNLGTLTAAGDFANNLNSIHRVRYAVKFSKFAPDHKPVRIYLVKGSLKRAKKIGGLRGLYLHYCYKLGFFRKGRKQNPARLHYLLKDDLLKMEYITQETRLLCRHHIDTAEQLFSYQQSLQDEMQNLLAERQELYAQKKHPPAKERLSAIALRLREIRKEVRQCDNIAERSQSLKEKLSVIHADEAKQRREMNRDGFERRGGGTGRPHELGGS